jgi:hypothetical protein
MITRMFPSSGAGRGRSALVTGLTSQVKLHLLDIEISLTKLFVTWLDRHRHETHLRIERPCLLVTNRHCEDEVFDTGEGACPLNAVSEKAFPHASAA